MTTTKFATDNLTGRARVWLLNSDISYSSWAEFKNILRDTFDIDPNAIGVLFSDAALYNSAGARSHAEYFKIKLEKINKLSSDIPEGDKVNIIITGINNPDMRQIAFANNYGTLDELLTYLRSRDHFATSSEPSSSTVASGKVATPSKTSGLKITCFECKKPGHKKLNCPQLRQQPFENKKISSRKVDKNCSICKKTNHETQNCYYRDKR